MASFVMTRICVIGGGSSGLVATKECLAAGFAVDCYEKTDNVGGLWRYREDDVDGVASVMKSTIINSSKEMSAFSDFQPPADFPNHMHNTKMTKYLELYAEKFDLLKHMKLRHSVVKVTRADDYEKTGRCFPGQDLFKGTVFHSHSYKNPKGLEDKAVVVLGMGNSAGDLAVELSAVGRQVYLATRTGCWVSPRVGPKGYPMDATYVTRMYEFLRSISTSSYEVINTYLLNERFSHELYNVLPKHKPGAQHIMVNDVLPNRISSGTVIMKSSIERFTQDGVVFEGETEETKCDVVILATGYRFTFPFFDANTEPMLVPDSENKMDLYKYVFPPSLSHAHTLGFIGLIQPIGALFPIFELHARWFVQLNLQKCAPLPPVGAMLSDIKSKRATLSKRYIQGSRHTVQVDYVPYMDEIASQFKAKPNLWKYLVIDPVLWKALFFGPCVPIQYRLDGPGAWPEARKRILTVDERIRAAFQTRSTAIKTRGGGAIFILTLVWSIWVVMMMLNHLPPASDGQRPPGDHVTVNGDPVNSSRTRQRRANANNDLLICCVIALIILSFAMPFLLWSMKTLGVVYIAPNDEVMIYTFGPCLTVLILIVFGVSLFIYKPVPLTTSRFNHDNQTMINEAGDVYLMTERTYNQYYV
ncbi:Flavin-containing monooxygenase 5 [Halotydeus destructor]|nr:Flavin-containing monooxygenase 5 [Halotydeus destructor]